MKKQIISLLIIIFTFISFNINSSEHVGKPLKTNKVIFIRHAKAPGGGDPEEFKIEDCKTQRNLNEAGIKRSKKIGRLFKKKKLKSIKFYQVNGVDAKIPKLAFDDFKEFSALNSTYTPPYDQNEKQQIKELRNFVSSWDGNGGNLVLVTYYVIILAVTETARSGEIVITDKNFKVYRNKYFFRKN